LMTFAAENDTAEFREEREYRRSDQLHYLSSMFVRIADFMSGGDDFS
jgi:hypothetical protein